MTRIVRMTRENDECFSLLPQLSREMQDFAREYGQRGIEVLCKRFEANFILDGNEAAAWVAYDDDWKSFHGYLVAFVEYVHGEPVVCVQQLRIDSAFITGEQREQVMEEFDAWARSVGSKEIMATVRVDNERLWKRYGFEKWRAIYRKAL